MLKLFKKSIWIPYEDSTVYPTVAKAQQAIIKYCEETDFYMNLLQMMKLL